MPIRTRTLQGTRIFAALLLFTAAVLCCAVQGNASKSDLVTIASDKQDRDPTIVLVQGMAEIVEVRGAVADIMVANPAIAEVSALQSNKLYIVGLELGTTNLLALDENGDVIKRLNIHVTINTTSMQRMIDELFPDEDVTIKALRGQVILTGSVSTPDVAQSIQNVIGHYITEIEGQEGNADELLVNLMTIKGKAQVMLRVKVMEVSRSLLRERGASTAITDIGDSLGDEVDISPGLGLFGAALGPIVDPDAFAAFGLVEGHGAFGPIESVISLLEDQGLARILAEPNLTAISGETAGFLAGGEFPVPAGTDDNGNLVITYRQFGVSLSFGPTVMSENRIVLRFETEVSSLTDSNVNLQGSDVPGLDVRRASTTVEMPSGTSLMIAGLLQSQTVKGLSGVPGIASTPVLGELFSSRNFRRDETEMVVLVTPYLVQPFGDKRQAKKLTEKDNPESNKLAAAFSRNIRRTYGALRISDIFDGDNAYGYIID